MGLSLGHLVIILIVVLLIFGPGRLSKVMNEFGKGVKSLRDGMKDETDTSAATREEKVREDKRLTDQRAMDARSAERQFQDDQTPRS